jgi:hypothetical protein
VVARYYAQYGPRVYARHAKLARSVLPEWTLEGTAFTSGITSRDNPPTLPLRYRRFRNVWSIMLSFKRGVRGGYLSVPEYDLCFEIADRSLLMFDGQGLVHGVTPFWIRPGGHRYILVYYSAQQMWRCLPPGEELARIRRHQAERERRDANETE